MLLSFEDDIISEAYTAEVCQPFIRVFWFSAYCIESGSHSIHNMYEVFCGGSLMVDCGSETVAGRFPKISDFRKIYNTTGALNVYMCIGQQLIHW